MTEAAFHDESFSEEPPFTQQALFEPDQTAVTPVTYELTARRMYSALINQSKERGLDITTIGPHNLMDFALLTHDIVHPQAERDLQDLRAESDKRKIEGGEKKFSIPTTPFTNRLEEHVRNVISTPGQRDDLIKKRLRLVYDARVKSFPEIGYAAMLQEELETRGSEAAANALFDVLAVYGMCLEGLESMAAERRDRRERMERLQDRLRERRD